MGKYNDNPWLGLESYQEFQIIYGRDQEIEELSLCILNNTETVLYGKSGIGKSSIINAGIIPILRANGYTPVVVRLDHSNLHSYIKQLSDIIQKKVTVSESTISKPIEQQVLWEYFHTHRFNKSTDGKSKLVIIFDQFEEIFTLQNDANAKARFFKELGDVINNVMPKGLMEESQPSTPKQPQSEVAKKESVSGFADMADLFSSLAASVSDTSSKYIEDNDIHFVFTLREDFLSEFEYHTAKIPSLRQHRYGLRPLNEEQAAEIIMRPRPGLVDEGVARLIIETITNRTDFSLGDEPEIDVDAAVLSLFLNQIYDKRASEDSPVSIELVKTFGKDIIKDFYEEAIEGLSNQQIDFLEDELLTGENRRDNLSRADFKAGGFSESDLKRLINDKKILRQFHYEGDLRVEFIHDILCPVVRERKEQREIQRKQEEERRRQEEEKQQLQEEAERKQREIEEKAAREKAELEAETLRVKKRNRSRLIALSSVIVFLLLAVGTYYYCFVDTYSENYGNFTTEHGWPIGLGPQLNSSEDKEKCTVFYKLSRKGRLPSFMGTARPFTKVEVLNWKGEPFTNLLFDSPFVRIIDKELNDYKAANFAKLLSRVSYWQYIPDANGMISKKTAFDINNNELYSETYTSPNNIDQSSKYVLWSVFTDDKGDPLQISDNGADRIRYNISNGSVTGCSFFTVLGTPQPNTSGEYGYIYEIDSESNHIKLRYNANKYGEPIDSSLVRFTKFDNGRFIESNFCNVQYSKQNVVWKYLNHCDTVHVSENGFIDFISSVPKNSNKISVTYKSRDDILDKMKFSNDTMVYRSQFFYSSKLDSVRIHNRTTNYTERYSYPDLNTIRLSFWNGDKEMTSSLGFDGIRCHEIITKTSIENSDSIITQSYYDSNGSLTSEGLYSKKEIIYDSESGKVLFEYYYNSDGEIYKSEMFSYNDYGIRISRAVAGIDRTPVRCPNWDWDGFTYYCMSFLKDFTNNVYVTIKGTNEFGDDSYILKNDTLFTISELPLQFTTTNDTQKIRSKTFGFSISKNNYEELDNRNIVPFIHILNRKSILYNAVGQTDNPRENLKRDGIYDNDIPYKVGIWNLGDSTRILNKELSLIEKEGGKIQVLRTTDNNYKILSFTIPAGSLHAEIHNVHLTDKEYDRIKKYK